jgi:hypothetical protein
MHESTGDRDPAMRNTQNNTIPWYTSIPAVAHLIHFLYARYKRVRHWRAQYLTAMSTVAGQSGSTGNRRLVPG